MSKNKKKSTTIKFDDGQSWSERELAQILRRKMITKSERNKKKYTRKDKHKTNPISREAGSFFFICRIW